MRIVVYELNEVPWRVLDAHIKRRPSGGLARLVRSGANFTTVAHPADALHPWVTWPTMHRGAPSPVHGVRFIGQDPTTFGGRPLWDIVRQKGRSAGLFGCLQSGRPGALGSADFQLPDCFAPDDDAAPRELSPFQRLIRANVRACGRVVGPGTAPAPSDLRALARLGVRPSTVLAGAAQVAAEGWDPRLRYRRPSFAGRLGFDLFLAQWRQKKPDYAAFFTTDLAFRMHRYWRSAFPADFDRPAPPGEAIYAGAIAEAMDHADAHLTALMRAADRDPALIVALAGSMGQAAVPVAEEPGALRLDDVAAMLERLGHYGRWTSAFAMEPDVTLTFADETAAATLDKRARSVVDRDGAPIFAVEQAGTRVSVHVNQHAAALRFGEAVVDGVTIPIQQLGLACIQPETPGTAHHIRDGVLVFAGQRIRPTGTRTPICATRYAPTVLVALGIPPHTPGQPVDILR